MNIFTKLILISGLLSILSCSDTTQATPSKQPIVKQSASGICHDERSVSYNRTRNYKPFNNIADCINAGGRLPKALTTQIDEATNEAKEQGRDFVSLYDRSDWPHWIDEDSDCQNTRHEILINTSIKVATFKTDKECNVLNGEWYDPYSGETFSISRDMDLDHIVPLKFAHGHGGDKWSRERKGEFANDLDNLILAKASLNRQKGAKGLDEWLPPNYSYRCEYIARFNAVMDKNGLIYIPAEQRIVNKMIKACFK